MARLFYSYTDDKADTRRLLARAVERQYGVPCPAVSKTPSGKPYFAARPDVHFSLSHTRGLVLVLLGDSPCGCDAERERPIRPGVPLRVCCVAELEAFGFLNCWVLKESYLKVTGDTRLDLRRANFSLDGGRIVTPSAEVSARLYELPGYRVAACSLGALPDSLERVEL